MPCKAAPNGRLQFIKSLLFEVRGFDFAEGVRGGRESPRVGSNACKKACGSRRLRRAAAAFRAAMRSEKRGNAKAAEKVRSAFSAAFVTELKLYFPRVLWYTVTKQVRETSDVHGEEELPVDYMIWVWLGAAVVFGVVEALTAGLVSIWFVAGSAAALIGAFLGAGLGVQVALFVVVSAAALAVTRPLVRRYTAGKAVPTNLDRVLGDSGKVMETIDNENSSGAVYVDGKTWTARSADGSVIPAGTVVEILRMEGVKLFVKKLEEKVEVVS